MKQNKKFGPGIASQRGAVTIVMSIVLLVLVTMVAVYVGSAVLFEQRVSSNEFRERQAFEAAESGLATGLAYLAAPGGADKDNDGAIDPVFDTDGDGIGNVNAGTYADNSSVTVSIVGTFPGFEVTAQGVSDDSSAMRIVRAIGASVDALPNSPTNPLTTRGNTIINGSATVHNPEGHSTIWSGSDVDLGSNNATATFIANPADPGYPTCLDTSMTCSTTRSSSKVATGLDVIENDSSLWNLTQEMMFMNFFGTSMANYRASRVSMEVAAANADNLASAEPPGIHLATGEVIWVEGDTVLTQNTTVGCEVEVTGANTCPIGNLDPSILIINGNLQTTGTPTFHGLLYVIGNMNLSGNNTIHGAAIISGDVTDAGGGSLDIIYNSDMLDMARDNGPLAASPGSWRDW